MPTPDLNYLDKAVFPLSFISDYLEVVADSDITDENTQIGIAEADLIQSGVLIGDKIGKCLSRPDGKIYLFWRVEVPGWLDDTKHQLVIVRRKRSFSMAYQHSQGAWTQPTKDPSVEEVYRSNDFTIQYCVDDDKIESGVEYCYTMYICDITRNTYIADTLERNPKSQISIISNKQRLSSTFMFNHLPQFWFDSDNSGSLNALLDVFSYGFNVHQNIIDLLSYNDYFKLFSPIVKKVAGEWGMDEGELGLGIDTMRRQIRYTQDVLKYAGCKKGIKDLVRLITTWQIDWSNIYMETSAIPFFQTYGVVNTPLWDDGYGYGYGLFDSSVTTSLGLVNEIKIIVEIPRVALAIGNSTNIVYDTIDDYTTFEDSSVDFTTTQPKEHVLVSNQNDPEYTHRVFDNDSTKLYVNGKVGCEVGDQYCVLTQIDAARLNRLLYLLQKRKLNIPYFCNVTVKFI